MTHHYSATVNVRALSVERFYLGFSLSLGAKLHPKMFRWSVVSQLGTCFGSNDDENTVLNRCITGSGRTFAN